MDRLKEIEEISTVISCNSTFPHRVIAEKISNRVVDKARKEIAQEIFQKLYNLPVCTHPTIGTGQYTFGREYVKSWAKEYGVEVEQW